MSGLLNVKFSPVKNTIEGENGSETLRLLLMLTFALAILYWF
jgi:hypothetical protein